MNELFKADWYELTMIGTFVSIGWWIGGEAVRIVWNVVYDLGVKVLEKMKPN